MNSELWEQFKFAMKLNLRYYPRLLAAPFVWAVRGTWQEIGRMDAEFDEFVARQNQGAADRAKSIENPVRPATSEQSH